MKRGFFLQDFLEHSFASFAAASLSTLESRAELGAVLCERCNIFLRVASILYLTSAEQRRGICSV